MRRLQNLTGQEFGYLIVIKPNLSKLGHHYWCQCKCGGYKSVSAGNLHSGHTRSCGCYNKERLTEVHTGHQYNVGRVPYNWENRIGRRHGHLTFIKHIRGTRWLCRCDCGNETEITTPNLSRTMKCRHCSRRKNITGERIGLLIAVSSEDGIVRGREPLWTFRCDCGNTIQGTVREFHAQWLRSCGCHENAHSSWVCMMSRCYSLGNNRYNSYGGRGIRVCKRWHNFSAFIADMGECPKRHNLGRKYADNNYCPSNCFWEHVSTNCRDTKNDGTPTKPGKIKKAKSRK